MALFKPEILKEINEDFLKRPHSIFVYPDNYYRTEYENPFFEHLARWSNGWGFLVTKKPKKYINDKFYSQEEYLPIFHTYLEILKRIVIRGDELNKHIFIFKMDDDPKLWEELIKPEIEKTLENRSSAIFLWEK